MNQGKFIAAENSAIAAGIYRLRLCGTIAEDIRPGQFVDISVPGAFLRRPFSVCDAGEDSITVVYRAAGKGTGLLAALNPGAELDVLYGLGNGYDLGLAGSTPLLIGGGMGATPLLFTARRLTENGIMPKVVLGFNSRAEMILTEDFEALGCSPVIATADGSCGSKGFVTDVLPEKYSYYYSCGPEAMFKAILGKASSGGEFSFEARMGCGFGACMGCTKKTKNGFKRVCKEGPVFKSEELIWED